MFVSLICIRRISLILLHWTCGSHLALDVWLSFGIGRTCTYGSHFAVRLSFALDVLLSCRIGRVAFILYQTCSSHFALDVLLSFCIGRMALVLYWTCGFSFCIGPVALILNWTFGSNFVLDMWRKLRKSIRLNYQYPRAPVKPEVDLDFRGHPNMVAL